MLLYTSRYTPNDFLPVNASSNLHLNGLGGVYSAGKAFPEAKWAEILIRYTNIILDEDQCSARRLSNECYISRGSASKAILYAEIGMLPPSLKQGNGRVGVGSMCGFTMEHRHLYIYHLYQRNPSRQLLGYVKKIKKKIGITISEGFMSRWFKTIGPFKETLRLTSKFPPAKGPLGNRLSSYTNISFSSPLWIIVDWYLQMRNHLKKRIFTTVYTEIR